MKEYIELNKPVIFSNCFTNTMKMKDPGSTTSRIHTSCYNEVCHRLGDSRKTIVRFVNRKYSFEALKNKKMLRSVDLTSIVLDKNTNLFLSQNLSDYYNKIAFHCRELRRKRLIDST